MLSRNRIFGDKGEQIATEYLEKKGYKIVERNAKYSGVETDVIAYDKNEGQYVFVEVKTRSSTEFGMPSEAVGADKQRRYVAAANAFAIKREVNLEDIRFDIVEVLDGKVNHIIAAFCE